MKTFTLSKKDLSYLGPLDAMASGINVAIQVYVINTVYKRLGVEPTSKARYDIDKGEIYVEEQAVPVTENKEKVEEKK